VSYWVVEVTPLYRSGDCRYAWQVMQGCVHGGLWCVEMGAARICRLKNPSAERLRKTELQYSMNKQQTTRLNCPCPNTPDARGQPPLYARSDTRGNRRCGQYMGNYRSVSMLSVLLPPPTQPQTKPQPPPHDSALA